MKPWLIISIFFVVVMMISNNALEIPDHIKKQAKKLHKRCSNQTDTPDEVIREAITGILPKNKNFECYIHCLFDIMGVIDDHNVIHIELLQQVLPEELHPIIVQLSQACGTKEGSDKCNIAYNTMQCYVDSNPLLIKDNLEFLFE